MDNQGRLKQDIERLVAQSDRLKRSNAQLKAQSVAAEARAEIAEARVEELEEQLSALLLKASIIEVAGGPKAARLRINRMIRDIDRCIAMSSK